MPARGPRRGSRPCGLPASGIGVATVGPRPPRAWLIVTHNREIARVADRVVELSSGRIVADERRARLGPLAAVVMAGPARAMDPRDRPRAGHRPGDGMSAGLGSIRTWRDHSADRSFALLRLHDLRVTLTEGSVADAGALSRTARSIAETRAITAAQERLTVPTQVDASGPGRTVLVRGRIVGASVGGSRVAATAIDRGRALSPADVGHSVGVLEANFAEHYGRRGPSLRCPRAAARARLPLRPRAGRPARRDPRRAPADGPGWTGVVHRRDRRLRSEWLERRRLRCDPGGRP